jgi:hypothetical protein
MRPHVPASARAACPPAADAERLLALSAQGYLFIAQQNGRLTAIAAR